MDQAKLDHYLRVGEQRWAEIEEGEAFKEKLSERMRKACDAVRAGHADWLALMKSAFGSTENNITFFLNHGALVEWCETYPDVALRALQDMWQGGNTPPDKRVRDFLDLVPVEQIRVQKNFNSLSQRLTPVSVLLMALGPDYPPFRWTPFDQVYGYLDYPKPYAGADEGATYGHMVAFLDHLVERARELGIERPRNRLEAQSIVWWLKGNPVPPPTPNNSGSLDALAKDLLLPADFLRDIENLLADKQQVIFQGPPGTGKTFVARKLAEYLAGDKKRVKLVQFHPSYAYEDFVQGFRPTLKDGQAGFELREGPLVKMAKEAKAALERGEDSKFFLVIDEINRGNLGKILGELYFLLEYREDEMQLQYSDEPFALPKNLYIIGTMNTADRSIALVDLALRRRFHFVTFHPDKEPIEGLLKSWLDKNAPDMQWVVDVVKRANEKLDNKEAAIGPSYFMRDPRKGPLTADLVERIWEHSVIPYVEEQLYGGPRKIEEFALKTLRTEVDAAANTPSNEGDSGQASAATTEPGTNGEN